MLTKTGRESFLFTLRFAGFSGFYGIYQGLFNVIYFYIKMWEAHYA